MPLRAHFSVTALTRLFQRSGQRRPSSGSRAPWLERITDSEVARAKAAAAIQARVRGWLQRIRTMTTFRLLFTAAPPDTTRRSGPTLGDGLRLRTPSRPVLHEAARLGDLPTIRQACDLGNDIDGLRFGFTALQLAAKTGRTDAVMLLLDLGASVRARATTGETALQPEPEPEPEPETEP